jgi:hypothetical protein
MDITIKIYKALIWLTLYACTLHFVDNVYFFSDYPEPAWLNAPIVGLLWIPLALIAHRAVDYLYNGKSDRTFTLVHGFVVGNWISLGHYLFASPAEVATRINAIIALQVAMATVLFVYALWLQGSRFSDSWKYTGKIWVKLTAFCGVAIFTLEMVWPSQFDIWWM